MQVWRLVRDVYAADPLGGKGGLVAGGRWHDRGRRVVYASGSLALATLEKLVHCGFENLPSDLTAVCLDIPGGVGTDAIEVSDLPDGWDAYPAPDSVTTRGTGWLDRRDGAVLRVPSAVVPVESNYLINPAHEAAASISVARSFSFPLDARLTMGAGG